MRKALKELRYQAEFMAPLFDKLESAQFIHQLKALQDVFGYTNDVHMTPRLIEIQQERQAGSNAARAANYALGHHEANAAHVWRRAGKAWRKLERSPHFWAYRVRLTTEFGLDNLDQRLMVVAPGFVIAPSQWIPSWTSSVSSTWSSARSWAPMRSPIMRSRQ